MQVGCELLINIPLNSSQYARSNASAQPLNKLSTPLDLLVANGNSPQVFLLDLLEANLCSAEIETRLLF